MGVNRNLALHYKIIWNEKKLKKKIKKKNTSDVINSIIPHRSPFTTILVWRPCSPPSREISRHQIKEVLTRKNKLNPIKKILELWNQFANPTVRPSLKIADNRGHGDSSTKWYIWRLKSDINIYLFVYIYIYIYIYISIYT